MTSANATAWALLVLSHPVHADTLADQKPWARTTAADSGWVLTKVFSRGPSGKTDAHDPLQRMLAQLDATSAEERPARILMIRLEQLGRGMQAIGAVLRLHRLGVTVHTRPDGDVSADRSDDVVTPLARLLVMCMQPDPPPKTRRAAKRRPAKRS